MILRFVCIFCLTLPSLVTAQVVDIPDSNLRAEIEYQLKKGRGEPITTDEMATVTYVHQESDGIKDLTGLEFAINLDGAYLLNNSISDISPLAGLTELQYLDLDINSISDISALAGLTNLMKLCLTGNPITDISPLAGLTNLEKLSLWSDLISDISPLAGLTNLEELSLSSDLIPDISPLAGLTNLTQLQLGGILESDISPLAGLTNLTELDLWNNSISDISALTGLTNLQYLDTGNNSISDLSPLVANIGLGYGDQIIVVGNPLSDISINTHIPALRRRGVKVNYQHLFFNPVGPVRVGDRFTVDLHLEGIIDLVGCQLNISFTSATLTALEVTQGNYFRGDCGQVIFPVGSIDNAAGAITNVNLTYGTGCLRGSDVLLSVNFEAKASGKGELNLHNTSIRTVNGEAMDVGILPFETVVKPSYDLNGDGQVNILDLTVVAHSFGQVDPQADVNGDGTVNILDLISIAQQFTTGD